MVNLKVSIEGIDREWMQLILEAKNMGIDKEEIREFLHNEIKKLDAKTVV